MKPFHTLTKEEAFAAANSSPKGLTDADAKERLSRYGKNALQESKKKSLFARFFDQLKDVMILVLIAAAAVSAVIAIVEGYYADLIDSGIILMIVIINAVIGLVQEQKAESSMEALKNLNKPFAKVLRDGQIAKVKSEEIVPGDVVILEAGDIVPADMRLFECASLKIEEAALTGESVPSEKDTDIIEKDDAPLGDRSNMAYSTGIVSYGRGQGVVVATAMNTEVGKIAKMLQEDEKEDTPLQVQLGKTAKTLSVIVLVIAVIIFGAAILRGFLSGSSDIPKMITDAFMTAVAIAVAAIPEGLPAVVTIVLAIGVQRMSEKKAIVRNLPAVEALGCCEVICSDKTGTLTLNQMTIKELYTPETGIYAAGSEKDGAAVSYLVKGMVLCNDTKRVEDKLIGDPTETALVAYADTLGDKDIAGSYKRIGENPFDSVRKLMSTVNETEEGPVAFIKGAPDILINQCSSILVMNGIRPITAADVSSIKEANAAMAGKALRVLGFAIKKSNLDLKTIEQDMVFIGLAGMIDPPRPEVKAAVEVCRKAGMRAVMITGDHIETAKAIAREIGILTENGLVISGAELDKISDADFLRDIERYCVFARVSPENKVRIVKTLKEAGKKVAMTGDGVNDAPSIKAADIGIGMGITGTDVSKGASDMVLADDNFATIVSAVEEGRKVYSNIKKAVQYLLSANIAEVLCLFIATVCLGTPFLTPVMILWVNLVTDSLPALSLGMEKAENDIMNYPPRKSNSNLFAGKTGLDIIVQGVMQTVLVLASFLIGQLVLSSGGLNGVADKEAMTMAFITLSMIQLFHAYNTRSQTHSLFAGNPFGNKFMNFSFIVCAALLFAVLIIPGVGPTLFDTAESLTGLEWAVALGTSVLIIPFVEIQKCIERFINKKQAAKNK